MGRADAALVEPEVSEPGGGHRELEDDFFCLRYRVWYYSLDCAFRTKYKTARGCAQCEQGRFNLKRHRSALARSRPLLPILD